jgi:hypothetical protein
MRNLLVVLIGAVLLGSLGSPGSAQENGRKTQARLLKAHQKEERKTLKLQQKDRERSLKETQAPRAVRVQVKHEMQRAARALREHQKDEDQDLKDRQRMIKDSQSRF